MWKTKRREEGRTVVAGVLAAPILPPGPARTRHPTMRPAGGGQGLLVFGGSLSGGRAGAERRGRQDCAGRPRHFATRGVWADRGGRGGESPPGAPAEPRPARPRGPQINRGPGPAWDAPPALTAPSTGVGTKAVKGRELPLQSGP